MARGPKPDLAASDTIDSPRIVGVGPHSRPWPSDPRLDPELLEHGDRRNVVDGYRYWRMEAIVADLDGRRHPFHVATENWIRDPNIGALVRNANAFLAGAIHIVGHHRWNRRGAMKTEAYQHVFHHADAQELVEFARRHDLVLIGIDNTDDALPLPQAELPRACMLVFGQEGAGLSTTMLAAVHSVLAIPQFGSTRSINAGAASAVAMYEWCRRHAPPSR